MDEKNNKSLFQQLLRQAAWKYATVQHKTNLHLRTMQGENN